MRPPRLPALIGLLVVGCLPKPRADTTRYYLLTAVQPHTPSSRQTQSSSALPLLGLGPVELPRYLDRSELVSRPGPNQLQVADDDRWGEPLVEGFRRNLRQDLAEFLGTDRIVAYPFQASNRPELVLTIDVSRFEPVGIDARQAELVARWNLRTGQGRVLATDETTVREPISGDGGQGAEVAALSRALARFAGLLGSAVRGGAARYVTSDKDREGHAR